MLTFSSVFHCQDRLPSPQHTALSAWELSWTVCHPQQTQAFIFLLCSECPFMAHPARCFLLCSCTPLSETLRAPCLSVQLLLRPCPSSLQENTGANVHNQPCSDGSPSPDICSDPASSHAAPYFPLPQVHSALTASFSWFATRNLSFCCCLLIQHGGFAPPQAPREIKYHSTALHHLPLNPASHLLILLLMMSICSLSVKQLLTYVIHSIDLIFFLVLFIPLGAS